MVLTMTEGEDFYIRDEQFFLSRIVSTKDFILTRARDRNQIRVTEGRAMELAENVRVSVGARGQLGLARVAIEAPRSVIILRGANYRKAPPHHD